MLEDRQRKHLSKASDHHLLETTKRGCHIFGGDLLSKPAHHDCILLHFKLENFPSGAGEELWCPGAEAAWHSPATRGLLLRCAAGSRISGTALAAACRSPSYVRGAFFSFNM